MKGEGEAPKLNRKQRRAAERAERKQARKARIAASRRTDEQRRERMRDLDDRTPLRPSASDLIVGPAAVRELSKVEAERRAASSRALKHSKGRKA